MMQKMTEQSGRKPTAVLADKKAKNVNQLPSKAPFSKRFEEAVGLVCKTCAVQPVARQFGLAASTFKVIDMRYVKR